MIIRKVCRVIGVMMVAFCSSNGFIATSLAAELLESHSLRHNLQVRLNPYTGEIQAKDLIEIEGDGKLSFLLAAELELHEVRLDGEPIPIEGRAGYWRVDLGKHGLHKLELSYSGILQGQGTETPESTNPQRPVIGPDASYLPPASGWYPEFELGPFTYDLSVRLPAPQKAVVPGRLIMEGEAGGDYQVRFAFTEPIRGIPFFAGPYTIEERYHGSYRLRTYFFEGMEALSDDYLNLSKDYLDLFAGRIGTYPFNSFNIVAARLPLGLGFPGITYIGQRVLALPFIKYSSLGHEILHNWWGNGVYVNYSKGNWAEGLTTYQADYSFLEQGSIEMATMRRLEWLRDYAALPPERDRPPRSFTSKTHTASQVIGYNKVAFLFHMLRRQLGRQVFESALRRFWREQRFRTASWDELERAFSEQAGRDLSVFFSQWLDRTGAPGISFAKVSKQYQANGTWRLSLVIKQTEPSYQLLLPVRILTGEDPEEHLIPIQGAYTAVEIPLAAEPVELVADPDFHLFRRLGAGEAPTTLRDTLLSKQTQSLVLGDQAFQQQALALARAMVDSPLQPNSALEPGKPFLLIGPSTEVYAFLRTHGLPGLPEELAVTSSSRVWSRRTPQGQPYVIVAADNLESLNALQRPLPHYGRRSYMAFQGSKAVIKGNWPIGKSGIRYRLP